MKIPYKSMLLLALMSLQSLPISARANVSGAKIESEGMDQGVHFKSEMEANQKATLSWQLPIGFLRPGTAR